MTEKRTVDCRKLACPQPVINTKDALEGATDPFVVIVDNEGSCANVRRFAEGQGARVEVAQHGGDFHLTIEPGRSEPAGKREPLGPALEGPRNLVVYISSAGVGRGDDELGAILMLAFLDTLAQVKTELSHVIFVNTGAQLTVEGSAVLEELRQLEELGAKLLVCGTCLNHFGIKDKLAVGSVSNMFEIIETLSSAGRIISP